MVDPNDGNQLDDGAQVAFKGDISIDPNDAEYRAKIEEQARSMQQGVAQEDVYTPQIQRSTGTSSDPDGIDPLNPNADPLTPDQERDQQVEQQRIARERQAEQNRVKREVDALEAAQGPTVAEQKKLSEQRDKVEAQKTKPLAAAAGQMAPLAMEGDSQQTTPQYEAEYSKLQILERETAAASRQRKQAFELSKEFVDKTGKDLLDPTATVDEFRQFMQDQDPYRAGRQKLMGNSAQTATRLALLNQDYAEYGRNMQSIASTYEDAIERSKGAGSIAAFEKLMTESPEEAAALIEADPMYRKLVQSYQKIGSIQEQYLDAAKKDPELFRMLTDSQNQQVIADAKYASRGYVSRDMASVGRGIVKSLNNSILNIVGTMGSVGGAVSKKYDAFDLIRDSCVAGMEEIDAVMPTPTPQKYGVFSDRATLATAPEYQIILDQGKAIAVVDQEGFSVPPNTASAIMAEYDRADPEDVTTRRDYNPSALWNDAPVTIADMLTDMMLTRGATRAFRGAGVSTKLAQRAGVIAPVVMRTHLGAYQAGLDAGMDQRESTAYGISMGFGIGLASMFNPLEARFVQNAGSGAMRGFMDLIRSSGDDVLRGVENLRLQGSGRAMAQKAVEKVVEGLKNGAGEMFEEAVLEKGMEASINYGFAALTGNSVSANLSYTEALNNAVLAFIPGAGLGALTHQSKMPSYQANAVLAAHRDMPSFVNMVTEAIQKGVFTQEEGSEMINRISSVSQRLGQANLDRLSKDQQQELAGLLHDKQVLNDRLAGATDGVVKSAQKNLDKLNVRISNLVMLSHGVDPEQDGALDELVAKMGEEATKRREQRMSIKAQADPESTLGDSVSEQRGSKDALREALNENPTEGDRVTYQGVDGVLEYSREGDDPRASRMGPLAIRTETGEYIPIEGVDSGKSMLELGVQKAGSTESQVKFNMQNRPLTGEVQADGQTFYVSLENMDQPDGLGDVVYEKVGDRYFQVRPKRFWKEGEGGSEAVRRKAIAALREQEGFSGDYTPIPQSFYERVNPIPSPASVEAMSEEDIQNNLPGFLNYIAEKFGYSSIAQARSSLVAKNAERNYLAAEEKAILDTIDAIYNKAGGLPLEDSGLGIQRAEAARPEPYVSMEDLPALPTDEVGYGPDGRSIERESADGAVESTQDSDTKAPDGYAESVMETDLELMFEDFAAQQASEEYVAAVTAMLEMSGIPVSVVYDAKQFKAAARRLGGTGSEAGVYDPQEKKIYLNPARVTKDTPIHEFAHPFVLMLKHSENPRANEMYQRGIQLVMDTPYYQQALAEGYEDAAEEALVQMIGDRGALMLEGEPQTQSVLDFIRDMFGWLAENVFGIYEQGSDVDIASLSLFDIGDIVATQLLSGQQVPQELIEALPDDPEAAAEETEDLAEIERQRLADLAAIDRAIADLESTEAERVAAETEAAAQEQAEQAVLAEAEQVGGEVVLAATETMSEEDMAAIDAELGLSEPIGGLPNNPFDNTERVSMARRAMAIRAQVIGLIKKGDAFLKGKTPAFVRAIKKLRNKLVILAAVAGSFSYAANNKEQTATAMLAMTPKAVVEYAIDNVLPAEQADMLKRLAVKGGKYDAVETVMEVTEAPGVRDKRYADKARSMRVGAQKNEDGTESTVRMATGEADGKNYAYPTLFQDEQGNFYESDDPFAEAKRRDELFDFGQDAAAAADFAKGSWKQESEPGVAEPAYVQSIEVTEDGLWSYRSQWPTSEGFIYIAAPNRGNRPAKGTTNAAQGVGHFLLDADVSMNQPGVASDTDPSKDAYSHRYNRAMHETGRKMDGFVPVYERISGNKIRLTYKRYSEVSPTDHIAAPLRQFKLSDIDWSKDRKAPGFKNAREIQLRDGVTNPYTSSDKTAQPTGTYLLFTGSRKAYGRFSGASVVFIFEANGNRYVRDFTGSILSIQEEAKGIEAQYGLSPDQITIGYHDVGSFNAKPAAKGGKVSTNQYHSFNDNPYTGGALLIPVTQELSTAETFDQAMAAMHSAFQAAPPPTSILSATDTRSPLQRQATEDPSVKVEAARLQAQKDKVNARAQEQVQDRKAASKGPKGMFQRAKNVAAKAGMTMKPGNDPDSYAFSAAHPADPNNRPANKKKVKTGHQINERVMDNMRNALIPEFLDVLAATVPFPVDADLVRDIVSSQLNGLRAAIESTEAATVTEIAKSLSADSKRILGVLDDIRLGYPIIGQTAIEKVRKMAESMVARQRVLAPIRSVIGEFKAENLSELTIGQFNAFSEAVAATLPDELARVKSGALTNLYREAKRSVDAEQQATRMAIDTALFNNSQMVQDEAAVRALSSLVAPDSKLRQELIKMGAPQVLIDAVPLSTRFEEPLMIERKRLIERILVRGSYSPDRDVVRVARLFSGILSNRDHVVAHEAVHAATVISMAHILSNPDQYAKETFDAAWEIQSIAQQYRANANPNAGLVGNLYGISNEYEFVAEFISNPGFRDYLEKHPPSDRVGFVEYYWDKILTILGLRKPERSPERIKEIEQNIQKILEVSSKDNYYNSFAAITPQDQPEAGEAAKESGVDNVVQYAPGNIIAATRAVAGKFSKGKFQNKTVQFFMKHMNSGTKAALLARVFSNPANTFTMAELEAMYDQAYKALRTGSSPNSPKAKKNKAKAMREAVAKAMTLDTSNMTAAQLGQELSDLFTEIEANRDSREPPSEMERILNKHGGLLSAADFDSLLRRINQQYGHYRSYRIAYSKKHGMLPEGHRKIPFSEALDDFIEKAGFQFDYWLRSSGAWHRFQNAGMDRVEDNINSFRARITARKKRVMAESVDLQKQLVKYRDDVATLDLVSDTLKGSIAAEKMLIAKDPDLANRVMAARAEIDALSAELIRIGAVPDTLQAIIGDNMGIYLRRSYKAFTDKTYGKIKVPEQVWKSAVKYVVAGYADRGDSITEKQAESKLIEILENAKNDPDSIYTGGVFGSTQADRDIFLRRGDVAPEMRAFLGEYGDAAILYYQTVNKMSSLIEKHHLLNSLASKGMGYVFRKPEDLDKPELSKLIAADTNKSLGPLAGLYTHPMIYQELTNMFDKSQAPWWLGAIMNMNAYTKLALTAYSVQTQMRNFWSNVLLQVANGHIVNNIWYDRSSWVYSVKATLPLALEYRLKRDPALADLRSELIELGLVGEQLDIGIVRDIYEQTGKDKLPLMLASLQRPGGVATQVGRAMWNGATAVTGKFQDFYGAGDEVHKAFAYMGELGALTAIYSSDPKYVGAGGPTLALKQLAAQRVRDTMPTYSKLPRAFKQLARFPFMGTFIAFPSEVLRISKNIVSIGFQDLIQGGKDGNWRMATHGMLRLGGASLAMAALQATKAAATGFFGYDDDDEKLKDTLIYAAPWDKSGQVTPLPSKPGRYRYINWSYMDPFAMWKGALTAYMRSEGGAKGGKDALKQFLSPFTSLDINTELAVELMLGTNLETGSKIYSGKENPGDVFEAVVSHIWETVQPGTIKSISRATDPKRNAAIELAAMATGVRIVDQPYDNSIKYKMFEYDNQMREAGSVLSRHYKSDNPAERRDYVDMYVSEMRTQINDLHEAYWAAIRGGAKHNDLLKALSNNGQNVNNKFLSAVQQNNYLQMLGETQVKRIIEVQKENPGHKLPGKLDSQANP